MGCLLLLFPALENVKIRITLLLFLFCFGLFFCLHFTFLVRTSNYTGNPADINHAEKVRQSSTIREVQTIFALQTSDRQISEKTYPAGPFSRSTAWTLLGQSSDDSIRDLAEHITSKRFTAHRLWHTGFTGIYGKNTDVVQLWYPGGKLKDGIAGLKYQ